MALKNVYDQHTVHKPLTKRSIGKSYLSVFVSFNYIFFTCFYVPARSVNDNKVHNNSFNRHINNNDNKITRYIGTYPLRVRRIRLFIQ